jgi:hypothetical protein
MIVGLLIIIVLTELLRTVISIRDTRMVNRLNENAQRAAKAWQAEQIRWRDADIVELKELVKGSKELERIISEIELIRDVDKG